MNELFKLAASILLSDDDQNGTSEAAVEESACSGPRKGITLAEVQEAVASGKDVYGTFFS